jgi:glycine cleavage system aminomethyltransferase T/glycine/D-amino acid oxidase-like deaminating enzyme
LRSPVGKVNSVLGNKGFSMSGTVIIGGGAIGLSVAYHLAKRGVQGITLYERNRLTSGTSWHAAGIVGPLRASLNMTRIAMYAGTLFPQLEKETGLSTGYRQTSGYWLARADDRMDELHRIAAIGQHVGLDAQVISAAKVASSLSYIDPTGVVGGLRVDQDASVNPVDLCMAYAKSARAMGVSLVEGVGVLSILTNGSAIEGVRLTSGADVFADKVVICAGAWSRVLAQTAGLALPLQAVEHMYIVTEPMSGLPDPIPVLRDLDRGFYVKGDVGRLVIGGFEPQAKCWDAHGPEGDRAFLELPEDWDQFEPFMTGALDLIPALGDAGVQRFMNGPESFTSDSRPLVGAASEVEGLFVAAGMNSVGIMSSAGIGRALADRIVDGPQGQDLWEIDVARADPLAAVDAHLDDRMDEAVADVFALHWPYKQPSAGRGLRKSALHDHWAAQGAHFGLTGGWERGLWYARADAECDLAYSTGTQNWQYIADAEAQYMAAHCGLVDLSPFAQFDVAGPDALPALQYLAAGDCDIAVDRALYTPFLDGAGGIVEDATVTRTGVQAFRVTCGAATRWKTRGWILSHLHGFNAALTDRTEEEVVIGVMGPKSGAILAGLGAPELAETTFGSSIEVLFFGVALRATRLSFVGELGWELSIPATKAGPLFDVLIKAGAKPVGHFAVDGCRLEKGFKHWGHDLGPMSTPLNAGLGFTIAWDKPSFMGKDALTLQKHKGIDHRLVLLDVAGHPLILHDEPIWEGGQIVGLTTSGGRGPRTGLTLAFGDISLAKGESLTQTADRVFQIQVAGKMYPAKVLPRPPYDPDNLRMRA